MSPVVVTNGPIILLGSWPFLKRVKVAVNVKAISTKLAINAANKGIKIRLICKLLINIK